MSEKITLMIISLGLETVNPAAMDFERRGCLPGRGSGEKMLLVALWEMQYFGRLANIRTKSQDISA